MLHGEINPHMWKLHALYYTDKLMMIVKRWQCNHVSLALGGLGTSGIVNRGYFVCHFLYCSVVEQLIPQQPYRYQGFHSRLCQRMVTNRDP